MSDFTIYKGSEARAERACRALSELLTLELRPAGEGFAVYSVLVPSPSAIRVARRTR